MATVPRVAVATTLALALGVPAALAVGHAAPAPRSALSATPVRDGQVIPGRYIVVVNAPKGVRADRTQVATLTQQAAASARADGIVTDSVLSGVGAYTAAMTTEQAAALGRRGDVSVFPDRIRLLEGARTSQSIVEVTDATYQSVVVDGSVGRSVIVNLGSLRNGAWVRDDMALSHLNRVSDGAWTYARLNTMSAPAAAASLRALASVSGDSLVAVRDGKVVGTLAPGAPEADQRAWVASMTGSSPAPRPTPTPTQSPRPTQSPSPTPTPTQSPRPTQSPSPTTTPTQSPRPTQSPSPTTTPTQSPRPTQPTPFPTGGPTPAPGTGMPWHLDRIDQHSLPLDGAYRPVSTGKGVHIYVVDSGITASHDDFGGRVSAKGFTAIDDGRGTDDCFGHGTHVASTAGGAQYGVAKEATLHAVRIYDCKGVGTDSSDIDALNWVIANAEYPAVINASWGGGRIESIAAAVAKTQELGIPFAAAAGNGSNNVCTFFPANQPGVIAVGATSVRDTTKGYSGHGSCLTIWAPGTNVTAAKFGTKNGTLEKSGTSMATPVVSGAAALYLQLHPKAKAPEVKQWIIDSATKDALKDITDDSPNRLLYVGSN